MDDLLDIPPFLLRDPGEKTRRRAARPKRPAPIRVPRIALPKRGRWELWVAHLCDAAAPIGNGQRTVWADVSGRTKIRLISAENGRKVRIPKAVWERCKRERIDGR